MEIKAAEYDDLRSSLEDLDRKIQTLESTISDKEATLVEIEASNAILVVEVERAREGEKSLIVCSNELKALVEKKQRDEAFCWGHERSMILTKLTTVEGFHDVFKDKIRALEMDLSSASGTITLLRNKLARSEEKLKQAWDAYQIYKSKAKEYLSLLSCVFHVRNRAWIQAIFEGSAFCKRWPRILF